MDNDNIFVMSTSPRRASFIPLACIVALGVGGICLGLWLAHTWMGQPEPRDWYNAFYVLFSRNEPRGLLVVVAFTCLVILWLILGARPTSLPWPKGSRVAVAVLGLATFAICAAGTQLVCHRYNLTADEYMADFQARLFLHGKIHQELPAFWQPMERLIRPTHAVYLPTTHSWMSSYLPAYAAIRAIFMSAHIEWLTNAALAATSIFAIAGLARNLWPNDEAKPVLAAALLGASPQFLVMAMTGYAMPAHLAFNAAWLWLYSDPTKRRFWLTPFVGAIALGLHQPFFHALFAVPFLTRLVWERRWKASLWFVAVYLVAIASWAAWWHQFVPGLSNTSGKIFGVHHFTPLIQLMYLLLLLGWLALPLPLLAFLGGCGIRRQPTLVRDAAASCLLTFLFYAFVRLDQAHGWGDRYFHGELACLILVAITGWDALAERVGRRSALTFVIGGVAASMVVQLPLRCAQAEEFIQPYAKAAAAFQSVDADLLAYDPRMAWYSADLRRNDPLLSRRPIIVTLLSMTENEAQLLQKRFPHNRVITEEEMSRLQKEIAR